LVLVFCKTESQSVQSILGYDAEMKDNLKLPSFNWIKVDKVKIEVIEQLLLPTNVKGIHSFLGHAGFYQRFILKFSQIARSLTHLPAKDAMFIFMEECLQEFHTLKKALVSAPVI
jgi:hypothetical protein